MYSPLTSNVLMLQQLIRSAPANAGHITDRSEGKASVEDEEDPIPLADHVVRNADRLREGHPNRAVNEDGRMICDNRAMSPKCLRGSDIWPTWLFPQAYRPDGLAAPLEFDVAIDSSCSDFNITRGEFERLFNRFKSSSSYTNACDLVVRMSNRNLETFVSSDFYSMINTVTLGAFGFLLGNETEDLKFGVRGLLPYVEGNDAVSAANLRTNVGYETFVDAAFCRADRAPYAVGDVQRYPLVSANLNSKWYERTTCCGKVLCGVGGCPSARIGYVLVSWGFVFYHRRLVSSLESGVQRFVYGLVSDNERFIRFAQLPNEPNPEVILQNRDNFFRLILLISIPGLDDSERALVGLPPLNQAFYTPASEAEVMYHEDFRRVGSPSHMEATSNQQYDHGAQAAFMSGLNDMDHVAVKDSGEEILRLTAIRVLSDDVEDWSSTDSGISEIGDLQHEERRIPRYGPIHYAAPVNTVF